MNVPIQAKPVLRVTSETVNYEDAVSPAENLGWCYLQKNCEGRPMIARNTLAACKSATGVSWKGDGQEDCINI